MNFKKLVLFVMVLGGLMTSATWGYDSPFDVFPNGWTVNDIEQAINAGTDVNLKDNSGWTLLMVAAVRAKAENAKAIELLIKAGADVNAKTSRGWTALMLALRENDYLTLEIIEALIKAGADVNARDENSRTPLVYAADGKSFVYGVDPAETVKALINAGADVNAHNNNGMTPLMLVAQKSIFEEHVGLLVDAGAEVNATDNDGWTALKYAMEYKASERVIDALKKAGAIDILKETEMKPASLAPSEQPIAKTAELSITPSKQTISETVNLDADMAVNGDLNLCDKGCINLNGHTLTINGNLNQSGGLLDIGNGKVYVAEDYNLSGNGEFRITEEDAIFDVDGDVTIDTAVSISSYQSNGTLKIGGDLVVGSPNNGRGYMPYSSHVAEFKGGKAHKVDFETKDNYFYKIQLGVGDSLEFTGGLTGIDNDSNTIITAENTEIAIISGFTIQGVKQGETELTFKNSSTSATKALIVK